MLWCVQPISLARREGMRTNPPMNISALAMCAWSRENGVRSKVITGEEFLGVCCLRLDNLQG
eukprot:2543734-Amphidinium_carterae.2